MADFDYGSLILQIYSHCDSDDVDKAVNVCLRLARLKKDFVQMIYFLEESTDDHGHIQGVLKLEQDASDKSVQTWNEIRAAASKIFSDTHMIRVPGSTPQIFHTKACEIDHQSNILRRKIDSVPSIPLYQTQPVIHVLTPQQQVERRLHHEIQTDLANIDAYAKIKRRVRSRCETFATTMEKQLRAESDSQNFLSEVQNTVHNYFKEHSKDVFDKLVIATEALNKPEPENHSIALFEVRRAIKSVADCFYPPSADSTPIKCSDGKERVMDDDGYLNRLHEFLTTTFRRSTSRDLLKSEFETLAVLGRRLNDLTCKGVHVDVTIPEAKQGVLGLYVLCSNIISYLQNNRVEENSDVN